MLPNGWHSERKLLASAKAVSYLRRRLTQSEDDHRPRAHKPTDRNCAELRHQASTPQHSATAADARFPQAVDNYVDGLLLSPPGSPEEAEKGGRRR